MSTNLLTALKGLLDAIPRGMCLCARGETCEVCARGTAQRVAEAIAEQALKDFEARIAQPRYKIVEGSQSAHCCFEATVVDTHSPVIINGAPYVTESGPQYNSLCECFDLEEAQIIVNALNGVSP